VGINKVLNAKGPYRDRKNVAAYARESIHHLHLSLLTSVLQFRGGVLFDGVNATMRSSRVSRARYTSPIPPASTAIESSTARVSCPRLKPCLRVIIAVQHRTPATILGVFVGNPYLGIPACSSLNREPKIHN
jgi:hypothetical protein